MNRRLTAMVATLLVLFTFVSCGKGAGAPKTGDSSDIGGGLDGAITVFAAASLTDAFIEIGDAFEDQHPGVSVDFSFAGSSSLREQILDGAPADVFASANPANMDQVIHSGDIDEAQVFATNRLQIVVPAGNPAGVDALDDFADESLFIGLCAEEVPCGEFGRQILDSAGVTPELDTNEPDVRALLTKVAADELDAGIVYVTDVISEGDGVEGIDIPDSHNVVATYPIGTVNASSNPDVAAAFVDFVLGEAGQSILTSYGFTGP